MPSEEAESTVKLSPDQCVVPQLISPLCMFPRE